MELAGAECGTRALSLAFAAMAALLVGLDRETETVVFIRRTATARDLTALWVMTVTASVAAGYHFLQLCRCMASAGLGRSSSLQSKLAAWLQFLLDQGAAYATFLTTMAGLQGSLVGVFGVHKLQWMKLCNIYGRFCREIGGGVICALVATFTMAIVAAISAHRLFKLYPRGSLHSKLKRSISSGISSATSYSNSPGGRLRHGDEEGGEVGGHGEEPLRRRRELPLDRPRLPRRRRRQQSRFRLRGGRLGRDAVLVRFFPSLPEAFSGAPIGVAAAGPASAN
ncbi:hypothetical protein ZIOFF_023698 [Zingiber officinale]|uniref:CASP-like protein n=2 Tax=Zingiber officinale TaxID=94328 RepID=A0A8J5H193_ZINOF|nr:hypothetical protein ZIOFF_023698 [Zingiber officinale]